MKRNDIQGLRAIAVLSVVIFHAFPNALPGGFLGVDLFFVISGYLISGDIIRRTERGDFNLADFYKRRARRILPALLVMLSVTLAVSVIVLSPKDLQEVARTAAAALLFVSNLEFYRITDYFSGDADLKPLLHTWSLAVEEQFYIFFPPVCFLIWRYKRSWAPGLIMAAILLSIAAAEFLRTLSPQAAFFFSPTRAFELLVGTMLAANAVPPIRSEREATLAGSLGLLMICVSLILFNRNLPLPGLLTLVPTIGAALVIHAGSIPNGLSLAISRRPMTIVGDISYSLYLWHTPVLAYARHTYGLHLHLVHTFGALVASFVLGWLSFRFVEAPAMQTASRSNTLFRCCFAATSGVFVFSAMSLYASGFPERFSLEANAAFRAATDFNPHRTRCHNQGTPIPYISNCVFGAARSPNVAVWGDSHGAEIVVALGQLAEDKGQSVMQITASACPPALGFSLPHREWCVRHNQQTLDALEADGSIDTVVLIANVTLSAYWKENTGPALNVGFLQLVQRLRQAGKRIISLYAIPNQRFDPPNVIGVALDRGLNPNSIGLPRPEFDADAMNWRLLLDDLRARQEITTIDPADLLCDATLCRAFSETEGVLYFNDTHLNIRGSHSLAREIAKQVYGTDGNLARRWQDRLD